MEKDRWKRIEELFYLALELPKEKREVRLDAECRDDRELLHEVTSLLQVAESPDGFLSHGGFETGLRILGDPGQVLSSGEQFGNYTIEDLLGRGGMGEVYLAEDTRLKRMVALKVLPSGFTSGDEGTRRLIHEAKTASALNHPNILTIYDVGEIGGRNYIASEHIEGITLRELLKSGSPLPLSEAIRIFGQIASALSAAHSAGTVHRDIKPENVMIREDGLVKVLDFGLAKPVPDSIDALSRNEDRVETSPGIILGTVTYMSPEQVRGKRTDARSDIWSLGVVLCEMLTGCIPFDGETPSDKIAAILKSDPADRCGESHNVSKSVRRVIAKALEKSPDDRYSSVEKMRLELEIALRARDEAPDAAAAEQTDYIPVADTARSRTNASTGEITAQPDAPRFSRTTLYLAGAVVLVIAGAVAAGLYLYSPGSQSAKLTKKRVVGFGSSSVSALISPDGRFVAHAVLERGITSLRLKDLESGTESVLLEPDRIGPVGLTFSNDSSKVYFLKGWDPATLYRIPISGGEPEKIAERVNSAVAFSPDGRSFAFVRALKEGVTALVVRDFDGAEREIAVREGGKSFGLSGAAWSPDGKFIANAVNDERGLSVVDIAVYPADGGEPRLIAPENWRNIQNPVWLPDGSGLVAPALARKGENYYQLWFFPEDGGPAKAITNEQVDHHGVSITSDGATLMTVEWQNRLNIWKLPGGKSEQAGPISKSIHAKYRAFALAPDGMIVFPSNEDSEGNRDIWIMNGDGTDARQLTRDQGNNILPCVTSDGRYILVSSNRADKNSYHIWRMNIDGSDPRQLTFGENERGPRCPPDPSVVYFHTGSPAQGTQASRIGKVSIEGGDFELLTDYPASRSDVSPDGLHFVSLCIPNPKSKPLACVIPIEGGLPVKTFELQQLTYLRWRPDSGAITITKTIDGVSNFWEQPLDGGPPRQVTNFAAELIPHFEWSADGDLYCSRGYEINDPVLITNFR